MKKFFKFHRKYYDLALKLEPKKRVIFLDLLIYNLLKDGYSLKNLSDLEIDDNEIKEAIDVVIKFKMKRDRNTPEYRLWREKVYTRDNFTCQRCKKSGLKLNAHHIKRWIDSIELRYEISNGITLCEKCHRLEHL